MIRLHHCGSVMGSVIWEILCRAVLPCIVVTAYTAWEVSLKKLNVIIFENVLFSYEDVESACCLNIRGRKKAYLHIAYRAHAVPHPFRAAKGLKCVFPV